MEHSKWENKWESQKGSATAFCDSAVPGVLVSCYWGAGDIGVFTLQKPLSCPLTKHALPCVKEALIKIGVGETHGMTVNAL